MMVDQAMITGESEAVESQVDAASKAPLEARNIVFSGSLVVDGSCLAVVIRTGDNTLMGTMVELTGDVGKGSSNLKKDIELFVFYITIFALIQAFAVLIAGIVMGRSIVFTFVNGFIGKKEGMTTISSFRPPSYLYLIN
jgi:magnesium-transporting ATPase (P-type)